MLSEATLRKIDREVAKYPAAQKQSAVMAALAFAQDELGHVLEHGDVDRLALAGGQEDARLEHAADGAVPPQPASVLLPLIRPAYDRERDPSWRLLFIRRARHAHDRHSGEVAFPGGRTDPGDPDPVATALRETEEELGLDPRQIEAMEVYYGGGMRIPVEYGSRHCGVILVWLRH